MVVELVSLADVACFAALPLSFLDVGDVGSAVLEDVSQFAVSSSQGSDIKVCKPQSRLGLRLN